MPEPCTLAVIVNFHNMRREAPRTLFALTPDYQRDIPNLAYEIVALDNGSTEPIDEETAKRFGGDRCRYAYVATHSASPAAAINQAVATSRAEWIMCLIDGARIPSPGVLRLSMLASKAFDHPFIYTLAMHLGSKPQNDSMLEGYSQAAEDRLLATVNWRQNGYALFGISSVALTSKLGFYSELSETNCFTMRRADYLRHGGLSEQFESPGGGLVNLDFFNRIHESADMVPVMLLGEATFHQFHGGVATNVPRVSHPGEQFAAEYRRIRGREFRPTYRPPFYFGTIPPECRQLMRQSAQAWVK